MVPDQASSSASMDRASFDNFWPGSSTTSGGGASLTHKALAGVPGLFRQRGASELGGLCLGPLIGRGSYARVYKGARLVPDWHHRAKVALDV